MTLSNRVLQWSEKIRQQSVSGKSAATWCSENSISYQSFLYWRKRLQSSAPQALKRSSFIELSQPSLPWLEISLPGIKLSLAQQFDRKALLRFVQMLRQP